MSQEKPFIHIDNTVTIGHIITTATVIITFIIWQVKLESRVDMNERLIAEYRQQYLVSVAELKQQNDASGKEIKDMINEVKKTMYRLEDKMDKQK